MYRSEEDYLKMLYTLNASNEFIPNRILSQKMDHSIQTVSEMINRLSKKGYVIYKPYNGVKLNLAGKKIAKNMLKKHRLWELFLYDKLGYSWDEIHLEAENLEHATSDKLMDALYLYLDEPKFCPHGNKLDASKTLYKSLNQVSFPLCYTLMRVDDEAFTLSLIKEIGLQIGSSFKLIKIHNNHCLISINENNHLLSLDMAKHIYVEETIKTKEA